MKLTNKDLLKVLSLQIGDKIKTDISILEVKKSTSGIIYLEDTEDNEEYDLSELVDVEYEILPRPKRVGNLKCETDVMCSKCPLRALDSCALFGRITLYAILERVYDDWENKDQEIHDLLKARLDKEVK